MYIGIECILYLIGDFYMMHIADIEGQELAIHIGIEGIAFDGDVVIPRNGEEGCLYRVRGIMVVDDMDASARVADKDIRVFDVDLAYVVYAFGGIAIDGAEYIGMLFINGLVVYIEFIIVLTTSGEEQQEKGPQKGEGSQTVLGVHSRFFSSDMGFVPGRCIGMTICPKAPGDEYGGARGTGVLPIREMPLSVGSIYLPVGIRMPRLRTIS